MFKHELGLEVETRVQAYKGKITARAENLFGCNRYFIAPTTAKDGKLSDGLWFDEDDIKVTGKGLTVPRKDTGGPPSRIV